MPDVTDPNGVQWSVHRRWRARYANAVNPTDTGNALIGELTFNLLQIVVTWPFWFIAKWLGVQWKIVIERDGTVVGETLVRGWRKSQRCIQELTQSAAAGTMPQSPKA
jgi:hypothetical protein